MKFFWGFLLTLLLTGCIKVHKHESAKSNSDALKSQSLVKRHYYNSYEKEIGFAAVVQVGNRLIVSGLTASGEDMEAQIKGIYGRLESILKDFGANSSNVVKEVIYTKNIEALKKNIATRKSFYAKQKYPASSWIQIDRLYLPEILIEVEFEVIL